MASTEAQERLLDAVFEDFATSLVVSNIHYLFPANTTGLLPLYSDSQVTIRIRSTSHEYKLPKALLCKQSRYFATMFEGPFREGEEQSAILEEIDGVVSPRSFQMLVQWVCLGRVVFREDAPEVAITTAIEFARLADMCYITGMESLMAEHIEAIIRPNIASKDSVWEFYGKPDSNTHCLTSQHITSAVTLPEGHPVRAILAAATVEGYLRQHHYKFETEASKILEFSADLLKAVRSTLESITIEYGQTAFEDPISRARLPLWRKNS